MNAFRGISLDEDTRSTAIEQCEMILNHLRKADRGPMDTDFLRVHTVALLQLVGEMSRTSIPGVFQDDGDDLDFLFRGADPQSRREL